MTTTIETSAALHKWDDSTSTREPMIPDEFRSGAAGLKRIYQELGALCAETEDEMNPPTEYALDRTFEILEQTSYALMPHADFPSGYVTTDDQGGIRIEWWHERTFCVHLIIGHDANAKEYVFYKLDERDDGAINRRVFPNRLASHLQKLNRLRSGNAE